MADTRVTYRINAPRERVYRALLDADAIQKWRVPNGMTSKVHSFDAREGGRFRVSLTYDATTDAGKTSAQTDTYHGTFKKLVENTEIVESIEFETNDANLQGEMTVTTRLTDDDGATLLTAIHEGLPPAVKPGDNELGWRMSLEKLNALLSSSEKR